MCWENWSPRRKLNYRSFDSKSIPIIIYGHFRVEIQPNLILKLHHARIIISYLEDYQSVVEEKAASEEEFIERVAGNPIHAYRLMKRLYFDWQTVEKEIKADNWRSIFAIIVE